MQPGKTQSLALILALTSLLGLACCSESGVDKADAAPEQPAPAAVNLPPSTASAKAGFAVSGPLIVEHQLDILAQRDGVVAALLSDDGSRVRAGDLLARLDDRQLLADLQAAQAKTQSIEADLNNWQAEAKVLEADYQRAQKMWDAQLITKEQLEHAKFKAEADQWDVKRVEQLLVNARETERSLAMELEKTKIRAPFSGIVARRYIREGQQVAKGDRLFWVTAEKPLRIRFTLPERFMGQLKKGEDFPLVTPDLAGRVFKVRVVQVSPVVDPSSSTFDVLMQVQGDSQGLRPGMQASVNLENLR